jgi:S-formylglutathione hydrolase FrmB
LAGRVPGRFEEHTVRSRVLEGNPLGDPHERPLWVYLPPGAGDDPDRRYPSIYVIQGYTGQVDMWWNRTALRPTVPELVDDLFAGTGDRPAPPPAIVVFVDCWTSLGGSQFLNSPGTGRYLDYLCDEVVAYVDERYPTLPAREHRGIAGKSSGGYGAMVAPDAPPRRVRRPGQPRRRRPVRALLPARHGQGGPALRDHYDGSYERFFADFCPARPCPRSRTGCCSASGPWPPATRPSPTAR